MALIVGMLFFLASHAVQEPASTPGQVVEKVVCEANPDKSYALYLPPDFSTEKKWPVLFAFDPRGRGITPVQLFQEAAEKLGFVIVSSNDYFSDGPIEPAWAAAEAMWTDAVKRLPLDPNRVYATGFSGGARMAWLLADYSAVPLAGIIGVGAGFPKPDILDSVDFSRLAFYGLVGERDFNYYEMLDLDAKLDGTSIPHVLTTFDDRHNWPPQALAKTALEWMQVESMRRGATPRDEAFLDGYFKRRLDEARKLEVDGDHLAAHAAVADLVRQQAGVREDDGATELLKELSDSKAFSDQRKKRERARREYDSTLARAEQALQPLRDRELFRPRLNQLIRDVGLPELKRTRRDDNRERALAAERVLESIRVAVAFYIPRDLRAAADWKRLQVSFQLALEISPDEGGTWFRLAGAYARDGQNDKAFEALRGALEKGFRRADLFKSNDDLASLRDDPRFAEILAQLQKTR